MDGKLERPKLNFVPRWEGEVEGWTIKYVNKHLWRVPGWMDFDDIMGDARLFFVICCENYPQVSEQAHFMALYKSCISNHINDMSTKATREPDQTLAVDTEDGQVNLAAMLGSVESDELDVDVRLMLEDAPPVIKKICEATEYGKNVPAMLRKGLWRESNNEYLSRLAGLSKVQDLMTVILDWVRGMKGAF